jgi:hypothetical protein
MSNELIPSQEKGKSVDLREELVASDENIAKKLFRDAVDRLCKPSLWHEMAGSLSASFVIDEKDKRQRIKTGDHIRIKIPGPGLNEGDGDDWVRVETIDENFDDQFDESFGIMLLVCPNPHTEGNAIAHFFAEGASSSFLVTRKNNIVSAMYKGRNEVVNTEKLGLTDSVRNLVVAGGAIAGVSELQWNAFLKGLLS